MTLIIFLQETTAPEWWPFLVSLAALGLSIIGGAATVPLVNRLKARFGLAGRQAQVLVGVVAVLLTVMTTLVEGVLTPETFTWSNAGWYLTTVVLTSQARYFALKDAGGFKQLADGEG